MGRPPPWPSPSFPRAARSLRRLGSRASPARRPRRRRTARRPLRRSRQLQLRRRAPRRGRARSAHACSRPRRTYHRLVPTGDELRALMRRFPAGVAVITVDVEGERLGLTVGSLVALSLDPPLVGVSVNRQAAMHELLRRAGGFAASLLAGGQEWLAPHFARGGAALAPRRGGARRGGGRRGVRP